MILGHSLLNGIYITENQTIQKRKSRWYETEYSDRCYKYILVCSVLSFCLSVCLTVWIPVVRILSSKAKTDNMRGRIGQTGCQFRLVDPLQGNI